MKTRNCPRCGAAFTPLSPAQKYCCPDCRLLSIRLKRIEWTEKNPEYYPEYYRRRQAEKRRNATNH